MNKSDMTGVENVFTKNLKNSSPNHAFNYKDDQKVSLKSSIFKSGREEKKIFALQL